MPLPWPLRRTQRVLETRIFGVDRQERLSPRTGAAHDFFVVECVDWCNVVPLTPAGDVVMVRQFRHGIAELTLELPGGMIDPSDPDPGAAAARELLEETGYQATALEPIGVIAPNPAMMTNRCHSFFARDVVPIRAPSLDAGEDIEVVAVPLAEIPARIATGQICHALVVVAFTWAFGLGRLERPFPVGDGAGPPSPKPNSNVR